MVWQLRDRPESPPGCDSVKLRRRDVAKTRSGHHLRNRFSQSALVLFEIGIIPFDDFDGPEAAYL
jgi:hypothetical protein